MRSSKNFKPIAGEISVMTLTFAKHLFAKFSLPKVLVAALAFVLVQLGAPLTAHAQNRVALVIGQSAYQKVVQLPNTANDASQCSPS